MEGDTVVALGRATVAGQTLFGHNSHTPTHQPPALCRTAARACAADERVHTQYLELPQAREVYAVLGSRPAGRWGYEYGLNEHQLAASCLRLRPTLTGPGPGLLGTDLVRLALERSRTARQAVDLLTSLVPRHGQGAFPGCPAEAACDHAFVLADASEAYLVETAGIHWVYQQVHEVRAVSDVRSIRQDWDWISPGLATHAIDQGWWPADGSKLDFAGALAEDSKPQGAVLRRWGWAMLRLQEQNGRLDLAFLRRLLADHGDEAGEGGALCRHGSGPTDLGTTASFVAALTTDPAGLPVAWCALGTPCLGVYFPLLVDGELPDGFARSGLDPGGKNLGWQLARLGEQGRHQPARAAQTREALVRLQARFDREVEEFAAEGAALKRRGVQADLQRQASLLMEHNRELFEEVLTDLLRLRPLVAVES